MCGGWRWTEHDYKPTPQPGDFVRIKVCNVCGKRARRPKTLVERKEIRGPKTWYDMRDEGAEFAIRRRGSGGPGSRSIINRITELGSCCHRTVNHLAVVGRVVRNVWSKDRHKVPSKFFMVVEVPRLKKKVWVNLDAHIELVTATDYLIENIGFIAEED